MVIIKTDEYAHGLKPEFIKKVVQCGWVKPETVTCTSGMNTATRETTLSQGKSR